MRMLFGGVFVTVELSIMSVMIVVMIVVFVAMHVRVQNAVEMFVHVEVI